MRDRRAALGRAGRAAAATAQPARRQPGGCRRAGNARWEVATSGPAVVASSADLAPRTVGATRRRHRRSGRRCALGLPRCARRPRHPARPGLAQHGDAPPASGRRRRSPVPGCRSVPIRRRRSSSTWPRGPMAPTAAIGIHPGPRAEWFTTRRRSCSGTSTWTVSSEVSRVGVRLDGPALSPPETVSCRARDAAGCHPGPAGRSARRHAGRSPDDRRLSRHRVVDPAALPLLAQRRPGAEVRFRLHSESRDHPTWG